MQKNNMNDYALPPVGARFYGNPLSQEFYDQFLIPLILIVSFIISLFCLYFLWRKDEKIWKKIIWSFIILIPVFGPVAYGGLFKLPQKLSEDSQTELDLTRHVP